MQTGTTTQTESRATLTAPHTPQPQESATRRRWPVGFVIGLLVITCIGAGVRLHWLDRPSMWIDELFTAQHSLDVMNGDVGLRVLAYPPTTLGLWLQGVDVSSVSEQAYHQWRDAGIDEYTLRLPSAIIGIATIPILGWLSTRLVDRRTALMVALLLALATWHLWVSQTARFYVQQILLYNVALILYYDGMERRSARTVVTAAVCLLGAFLVQVTSLMLVGVCLVDAVMRLGQGRSKRAAAGNLAALLGFTCLGAGFGLWWYDPTQFHGSVQTPIDVALGTAFLVGLPVAITALGTGLWLWQHDRRLAAFLLAAVAVPPAAIMALGMLGADIHVRYVCPAIYSWLLLTAIGLNQIAIAARPRLGAVLAWTPAAAVVLGVLFADYSYFTGGHGYRARWRDAFEYVQHHREPGEPIVADYIPSHQARYYLEEPEVRRVSAARRYRAMRALDQSGWLVVRAVSPTGVGPYGRDRDWLDLRTYFNNRVLQPYSSVHVYYYDADKEKGPADEG